MLLAGMGDAGKEILSCRAHRKTTECKGFSVEHDKVRCVELVGTINNWGWTRMSEAEWYQIQAVAIKLTIICSGYGRCNNKAGWGRSGPGDAASKTPIWEEVIRNSWISRFPSKKEIYSYHRIIIAFVRSGNIAQQNGFTLVSNSAAVVRKWDRLLGSIAAALHLSN